MRIISGILKGKKLTVPSDKMTRPLRDIVKESIFNLIEHSNKFSPKIKNMNVLDLFSGSGSFGLECISRGAKNVIFVENYAKTLEVLKENIFALNVNHKCKLIEKDIFYFLKSDIIPFKFNIIFIDPPYKEGKINELISSIKNIKILNKNGIIILHRHKKDFVKISSELNVLDTRTYGISKIIIGH
mgnify:CR=1 FL=1